MSSTPVVIVPVGPVGEYLLCWASVTRARKVRMDTPPGSHLPWARPPHSLWEITRDESNPSRDRMAATLPTIASICASGQGSRPAVAGVMVVSIGHAHSMPIR